MQANKLWDVLFSTKHIKEHFEEKVSTKTSVGLDKVTVKKFKAEIEKNVEVICRKVRTGTYTFTRYKQLLFLKGPKKLPRAVCVPTIRDKLTLSVLNELIARVYGEKCKTRLPQLIINEISNERSYFDSFIKLDIKSFYSSIDQEKLMNILRYKIRKKEILHLIENAIQTESLSYPVKEIVKKSKRNLGVPEGLSISNALANIYLSKLDEKYQMINNIRYWRYVDDILIFTNQNDLEIIESMIENDIIKLGLSFNEKKAKGCINDGFEYLGYKLTSSNISVRKSSILKFEQSIEDLIRAANGRNIGYITWKLNNKITGFVLNDNKYGWMFFYSQINDMRLLFHLDNLVFSLLKRYKLDNKIKCKRFVRTYYEITKALHITKYIPNYDNYKIQDKRDILEQIYDSRVRTWADSEVEHRFQLVMSREIRDIERDIEHFS